MHLIAVYDGAKMYLYVNGTLDNSVQKTGDLQISDHTPRIGTDGAYGTRFFNGIIDEVRIYNRALSVEEIRYHYNRGGPVAHWKMDEGEGRTVYDATENDNDGTLGDGTCDAGAGTCPVWTTGKYGTGLLFDGENDYVDAGNVYDGVKTISFWIKADNLTKDIIHLGNATTSISSGTITTTGFTDPTIYVDGIVSSTIDTGWHYVSIITDTGINANDVDIGRSNTYFDGILDDVRFYSYVRTAEEIRLDYNEGMAVRFGPTPMSPGAGCDEDPAGCMDYGLAGYWNFDEGSGATSTDGSDYGNDGTLTSGPAWTAGAPAVGGGWQGTALEFDGVDDYVDAGNDASLYSDDGTWELWLKTSDTEWGGFISTDPVGNTKGDSTLILNNVDKKLRFWIYNGASEPSISSNNAINDGLWHHVAITFGSGGIKMYVDGVLQTDTDADTTGTTGAAQNIVIGAYRPTANFLSGLIDEVRIYNRALSAEEVRYHYNRGGPVGYWKMNEGEGRTVYDSTNNNNDGTLVLAGSATSSAWVQGKYGSALSLDGTDDYVDTGSPFQATMRGSFTIGMWIKPNDGMPASTNSIFGGNNAASEDRINIEIKDTGKLGFFYESDNNQARTLTADVALSDGQENWHHLVLIADSSAIGIGQHKIYLDGTKQALDAADDGDNTGVTYADWTSSDNMWIGCYHQAGTPVQCFDGLIDDVRIYNHARTQEQILQDYNAGLSAYFK